jgi:hypothetical protein
MSGDEGLPGPSVTGRDRIKMGDQREGGSGLRTRDADGDRGIVPANVQAPPADPLLDPPGQRLLRPAY